MAKRTAQLAGLAALGALGYMLTRGKGGEGAPVETRSFSPNMLPSEAEPEVDTGDFLSRRLRVNPETGQAYSMDNLTPMGPATPRPAASRVAPVTPRAAADVASVDPANISDAVSRRTGVRLNSPAGPGRSAGVGGPTAAEIAAYEAKIAASRNPNISAEVARRTGVKLNSRAGAGRSAGRGGPTAAELAAYEASRRSPRTGSAVDQIPTSGYPTVRGEPVTGTEFSRNVSNTLNALTPLGGGVAKAITEGAMAGRTQRAYNAAQQVRRGAEGMSPEESLAALRAAEEAARAEKIGNPLFWMSKGQGFKKGGAAKTKAKSTKMSSGGGTKSASRRGDGIAMRGKTRGKLY